MSALHALHDVQQQQNEVRVPGNIRITRGYSIRIRSVTIVLLVTQQKTERSPKPNTQEESVSNGDTPTPTLTPGLQGTTPWHGRMPRGNVDAQNVFGIPQGALRKESRMGHKTIMCTSRRHFSCTSHSIDTLEVKKKKKRFLQGKMTR